LADEESPVDFGPGSSQGGRQFWAKSWPYLLFIIPVAIYNYLFLGQGFNGTDEGYLLSLGQRVANGDRPYLDFYFLRTPLSIYIQAGLVRVLGDSYTILASRIYWAVEIGFLTLLLSAIYRRFASALELFLLLLTTYIILGLLLSFPWYNTDAAFFAGLAVVLLYKKLAFPAGLAIGLAFMTKQGYGLMLPLFLAISGIIHWKYREIKLLEWRTVILLCIGSATPVVIYSIYLLFNGGVGLFVKNILLLPAKSSGVGIGFTLFQNNLDAFLYSIPMIISIFIVFYAPLQRRIWVILAAGCFIAAMVMMLRLDQYYVFNFVMLNYTVAILAIIGAVRKKGGKGWAWFGVMLPAWLLAAVGQYISGYNYAGLASAYLGAGILISFTFPALRFASPGGRGKEISIALILIILAIGAYHKHKAVYRDEKRPLLTSSFSTPKLKGIMSTERNVKQIEGMISTINQYTSKGDYVYVFPDFPALYYLTDRKNPTRVEWPFFRELNGEMIIDILDSLESKMPKIVLLQTYPEADFGRAGSKYEFYGLAKYRPFIEFFKSRYKLLKEEGDVYILTPTNGKI